MKVKLILLLPLVLILSGCIQQQKVDLENENEQIENSAEIEYRGSVSYLKTKSYGVVTEFVYNEPKHSIDIDESSNLTVSLAKMDGSKVEGATVKIVGEGGEFVLNESFLGSYVNSIGLKGGKYTLFIDIDGDGENEGEQQINIPGTEILSPEHGGSVSTSGFDLKWNVSGDFKEYQYTYSLYNGGEGSCRGRTNLTDSINAKDLSGSEFAINESIEDGYYQIMFKTIDFLHDSNNQDSIQFSGSIQEMIDEELIVGEICQCCNPFAPACDPDKSYPNC